MQTRGGWTSWLLGAALLVGAGAQAAPLLRCELTYAGRTSTVEARPVTDPYRVPAQPVGEFGRFHFQPVLVGEGERIDRIALYVYMSAAPQPLLIQQAKYLPPFAPAGHSGPLPLTGEQRLYAGPMERELIYQCHLHGVQP